MSNVNLNHEEIQDFLTSLNHFKHLENYEHLGYTLHSICNVMQTALLAETECKQLTLCHSALDIYNLLSLVKALIPTSEWELLDKINS